MRAGRTHADASNKWQIEKGQNHNGRLPSPENDEIDQNGQKRGIGGNQVKVGAQARHKQMSLRHTATNDNCAATNSVTWNEYVSHLKGIR